MIKSARFLMMLAVLGVMIMGCSQEQNPVMTQESSAIPQNGSFRITLPAGATLQSATFYIYVTQTNNQVVNIHRVTAPWDEATVTWNNFGGSYAPDVWGSFTINALGYLSVDVTNLVREWMNGTYSDYGFLMDQVEENYPRATYRSRESLLNKPFLRVCYLLNDQVYCMDENPTGDAEISELYADDTHGLIVNLFTGWNTPTTLEKQSLVKFDIEVVEQPAALGDFVWLDENRNGIQDVGEDGVASVVVELYNCAGQLLATTVTNASGYYLFSNLPAGDYNVKFILPNGYEFTLQNQGGDDALDSDADPTTGVAACTTLEPGETDLTWDAGLYMPVYLGCTRTIGYWKNHAGFKRQADMVTPLLPVFLGTMGGEKTLAVTTARIAVNVLGQQYYGDPSNGITKLYAQLLGAKLNLASGASNGPVDDIIADADEFLADHNWRDWTGLSDEDKDMILGWHYDLDQYNMGLSGVLHCDY